MNSAPTLNALGTNRIITTRQAGNTNKCYVSDESDDVSDEGNLSVGQSTDSVVNSIQKSRTSTFTRESAIIHLGHFPIRQEARPRHNKR